LVQLCLNFLTDADIHETPFVSTGLKIDLTVGSTAESHMGSRQPPALGELLLKCRLI
jgi:hypothetical protein